MVKQYKYFTGRKSIQILIFSKMMKCSDISMLSPHLSCYYELYLQFNCYIRIKVTHSALDCILACLLCTFLMSFLQINSFVSSIAFLPYQHEELSYIGLLNLSGAKFTSILSILFLLILVLVFVLLVKICSHFFEICVCHQLMSSRFPGVYGPQMM